MRCHNRCIKIIAISTEPKSFSMAKNFSAVVQESHGERDGKVGEEEGEQEEEEEERNMAWH